MTSIKEIENLDISVVDKLELLLKEGIITKRDLRLLACKWARDALEVSTWKDLRSLDAIKRAEEYARNDEATKKELSIALDNAWVAVKDAEAVREDAWVARNASTAPEVQQAARVAELNTFAAWACAWTTAKNVGIAAIYAARTARAAAWHSIKNEVETSQIEVEIFQLEDIRKVLAKY